MRARGDDAERTDGATAGDQYPFAEQRPGAVDGVQRNREGFGKGALAERNAVSQSVTLARFGDELLAKSAIHMRHPHGAAIKAHVEALVLLALEAIFAGIARKRRRHRDPVADGEIPDAGAKFAHRAGHLMAKHHRMLDADRTKTAMIEIVEIGTADASCSDGDRDLAEARPQWLLFFDAEILGGMDDDCFHVRLTMVSMPRWSRQRASGIRSSINARIERWLRG